MAGIRVRTCVEVDELKNTVLIEKRLELLRQFHDALDRWFNSEVAAYRTKWRHLLMVIYDFGVIDDPYQLRTSNLKLFGVSVVVVKH
jgi:hypothetical protein